MDQQKIKTHYKHIIIGGGIIGSGILRDMALHAQDVLLIEKGDFAGQTSQGSSKMLHGGIRYLENLDFLLVFEALREKKIWLKLAGHIAQQRKFYLPIYKNSKWPLFFLRIGLFIYDFLSLFKNAPYAILNREKTLKGLPGLNGDTLRGAGLYSDGVIDDSKLVLDLIFDSMSRGAHALNYHELKATKKENNKTVLTIFDQRAQKDITISCDNLIFAVGPFTDQIMHLMKIPWENIILPSKGTHLWLKKDALNIQDAMVLQTNDHRIIFVIPQRNAILVGTTEVEVKAGDESFFNIKPSAAEITYLLDTVNEYFPAAKVNKESILSSFAAIRPLVKSSFGASRGKTSRKHKIFNPQPGTYVIAGGKYTTFRVMAQDICKKVFKDSGISYNKKLSLTPFDKKSIIYNVNEQEITTDVLTEIIRTEMPLTIEDLVQRRLSLYSIDQYKDPEDLQLKIDEIKSLLPAIRETK